MNGSRWRGVAVIASVATIAVAFLAATPTQRSTVITPSSAGKVLRRDDIARVAREQKNAVVSLHTLRGGPGTRTTPRLWVEPLKEGLGSGVDAEVVGRDAEDDLALVRAVGFSSRPAVLGDSDRVEVGDWVVARQSPSLRVASVPCHSGTTVA